MTFNQFQSEVAFLWKGNGENYDRSHADDVKHILQTYGWEIGQMELKGRTRQEQVAFAWEKYKETFPHLVG